MNKQLQSIITKLAPSKKNKKNNNSNKRNKRTRSNRSTTRSSFRALPAAYTAHVRARFTILSRNSNRCVVSGCDLVYAIPATLAPSGDTIFTVIPCNPAYWSGTRIARIAPAYQNYRPLQFKVSYIPQVAVTQAGTVFMGTLWDEAAPSQNIQQSLVTSNGGQLTQCYIPADSTVTLGRNLQQNLFKITGALDTNTNPFTFLAGVRGADVVPGYFYVTYRYEFKNPIGDAWTFINSGLKTISDLPEQSPSSNGTIVLLSQVGSLGPGTQLNRESDGIYYNGSLIDISDQTQVVYFNNFQTVLETVNTRNLLKVDLEGYDDVETGPSQFKSFNTLTVSAGESVTPGTGQYLLTVSSNAYYISFNIYTEHRIVDVGTRYALLTQPLLRIYGNDHDNPLMILAGIASGDDFSVRLFTSTHHLVL